MISAAEAVHLHANGTELLPILRAFVNINPSPEEVELGALSSWSDPRSIENLQKRIDEADDDVIKRFWEDAIIEAPKMQPGDGLYTILGRCGLLDENNRCTTYDDRPRVCHSFEVGSDACVTFRDREDIPTPVSISPRP